MFSPPRTTALGSLIAYITQEASSESFQPMNVNFGLFPSLNETKIVKGKPKQLKGRERKLALSQRALKDIRTWYQP